MNSNNRFTKMSVNKLVKAEWNYKREDEKISELLENNIRKNGQIENVIVRELDDGMYEVVNGNHRYDVLKNIGVEEVVVCNLGKITEKEAKRIAIETNETKFSTNPELLAKVVDDILNEFGVDDILTSIPFSKEQLEEMQLMLEPADLSQFGSEVPELNKQVKIKMSKSLGNRLKKQFDRITKMEDRTIDEEKAYSDVMNSFVDYLYEMSKDDICEKANKVKIVEIKEGK